MRKVRIPFVILLVCVAALAHAGIKESGEWIVTSRTHSFLKAVTENLGFDSLPLRQGRAVAWVGTTGVNVHIAIVGPIAADAKKYARIIDGWRDRHGLPGDVLWTQENDCAAAEYRYQPGHIGMYSAKVTIDLDDLRSALASAEPATEIVLNDAPKSDLMVAGAVDHTFPTGTRYWDITSRKNLGNAVAEVRIPAWMPWLLLAWFLIPPVGVMICFIAGLFVAKNDRIPIPARRKLYGRVITTGAMVVIGLHALLVIGTLPTRLFEPLAQFWFGQRFTLFAIPIIPLFVVFPILGLLLMSKVEKRLMAPTPEEAAQQVPIPGRELEKRPPSMLRKVLICIAAVGLLMKFGLIFTDKSFPDRNLITLISTLLTFLPIFGIIGTSKNLKFKVEPIDLAQAQEKLQLSVLSVSSKLGMVAPKSRVLTEAIYGRYGALADNHGIGMTLQALEQLDEPEIDFLVAHELSHLKLGHITKRRYLMFVPMAFILIPFSFLLFGRSLAVVTPGFIFSPFLIMIAFMVPYMVLTKRMMRKQEFEADRLAVTTTGDASAAIATLKKIALNSARPGIHDTDVSSHPAIKARIDAIAKLA